MGCWHSYLSGARCRWFSYDPADATATRSSVVSLKSHWFSLSGAGLPRLSWNERPLNRFLCVYLMCHLITTYITYLLISCTTTFSFTMHMLRKAEGWVSLGIAINVNSWSPKRMINSSTWLPVVGSILGSLKSSMIPFRRLYFCMFSVISNPLRPEAVRPRASLGRQDRAALHLQAVSDIF